MNWTLALALIVPAIAAAQDFDASDALDCQSLEVVDGVDNDCDGIIDEDAVIDSDGDGFAAPLDCDDSNASVNPDAPEMRDGIDNDCDGLIDDEDLVAIDADASLLDVVIENDAVVINGSEAVDRLFFEQAGTELRITDVVAGARWIAYDVTRIHVNLGRGDDAVTSVTDGDTRVRLPMIVRGGQGNDTIRTADGRDVIHGGEGNDVVNAGRNDDVVYGGPGNDNLIGAYGRDTLIGEDGMDLLQGGFGADLLIGGREDGSDDRVRDRLFGFRFGACRVWQGDRRIAHMGDSGC